MRSKEGKGRRVKEFMIACGAVAGLFLIVAVAAVKAFSEAGRHMDNEKH